MRVLDLFSGIGGFSIGLERTGGFNTVAFCEIESFPRAVLAKHWPEVPCYDDVRTLTAERLRADGIAVDVICGGFPCQDISVAGRGAGLGGERSGLWSEYARLIEEIRPRWVIIENVPALRGRGLDQVLGCLASIGYDAEWHLVSASAIGAPHQRDRVWIVAHAARNGGRWARIGIEHGRAGVCGAVEQRQVGSEIVADAESLGCRGRENAESRCVDYRTDAGRIESHDGPSDGCSRAGERLVADTGRTGLQGAEQTGWREPVITAADIRDAASQCGWRRAAPGLDGKADGLPGRMDGTRPVEAWEGNTPRTIGRGSPNRRPRLKAIGNSVVPQIPELIGRAILRAEAVAQQAAA